jgi:hypothetical protein
MVNRPVRLLGITVGVGLLAGAAVSLLAFYVARYGPSGDGWSFRGNGALAAYTAVPPILSAGWTALVLHCRTHPAWLALGLGAGFVGLLIAAVDAALLPVFGPDEYAVADTILLLVLVAWTLVAPISATRIKKSTPGRPVAVGLHAFAAVVWLASTLAGLIAVGIAIPAGS